MFTTWTKQWLASDAQLSPGVKTKPKYVAKIPPPTRLPPLKPPVTKQEKLLPKARPFGVMEPQVPQWAIDQVLTWIPKMTEPERKKRKKRIEQPAPWILPPFKDIQKVSEEQRSDLANIGIPRKDWLYCRLSFDYNAHAPATPIPTPPRQPTPEPVAKLSRLSRKKQQFMAARICRRQSLPTLADVPRFCTDEAKSMIFHTTARLLHDKKRRRSLPN
eukprot:GEMP01034482.1.p1 GENE.GEMP01034482.1~~GEMP01034482.1.p1  ORF type:complete len:217 (+),score=41.38 GEMP01034482.1:177-827(+)